MDIQFKIGDIVGKNDRIGFVLSIDGFWLTIQWFDGTESQELDLYMVKV